MLTRLIENYLAAIWKDWLSRMTTIASLIFVVTGLVFRITGTLKRKQEKQLRDLDVEF